MQTASSVVRAFLTIGALVLPVLAQAVVCPDGYVAAEGNSNNAFPWNRATQSMHYQQIYDSSNFTAQSIGVPVLITRLRFRADANPVTTSWAGGSWPNVQILMSTSAVDFLSATGTFATNHGPDLATVYTGPVTVLGGTGGGTTTPSIWYIDIPLTTTFLYDPVSGSDLNVEVILDGAGWSGTSTQCDAVSGATATPAPALVTRIYNTSSHTATTGTVGVNYGLVTEFTCLAAAGAASVAPYGTGCYDRASASFYEVFPAGTFDLSNTSITMLPTGTGYVVTSGTNTWWTPVGANLGLTDDSVSLAQPLGFTFAFPGGSTTNLFISSNGFVWPQANTNNGCCGGVAGDLLALPARFAALWNDLNPATGGSVVFDVDPSNLTAYVTFTGVNEFGTTNANTFQMAFHASGVVDMRWQNCSVLSHITLTGWSPGGGARDPGNVDLSATPVLITMPDSTALALTAAPRPVLGNTVVLTCRNVPTGTPLGVMILSITQHNPGIDLTSLGMPGCFQYVGLDAVTVFFPVGSTGTMPIGIPNNVAFAGVHLFGQAAAFVAGLNPLGVTSSNALNLGIGTL